MSTRMLAPAVLLVAIGAIGLAACGSDTTSIRSEPPTSSSTTSTSPDTGATTTSSPSTSLSTKPSIPADAKLIHYGALQLTVPAAWPVYDLRATPRTCVRADVHAVYLGKPGPSPDCPARIVGHTETVQLQALSDATPIDVARATQPSTVSGLAVRVDPTPDANGALTVVFEQQGVLAIITYSGTRAAADSILATATLA